MKRLLTISLLGLTLSASAQWAHVYTTTVDRQQQMAVKTVESTAVNPSASNKLTLTSNERNRIDGFGYAISYSAAYNLLRNMTAAERANLLRRTFSPTEGYGVSYVRIAMGGCDFSSHTYSYCDIEGPASDPLQNFALASDEIDYVIPVLKEIKAINPDVRIIASPWTPPCWMKTNNWWQDGNLKTEHYGTYGRYFARFIEEMAAYGITVDAVTVQNEPLNHGNTASMYTPWDQEADFIRNGLAPALKNAKLNTRIYVYDHNYNYDNISDQEDYPVKLFQRMGSGFTGEDLVAGVAWHNYGGNVSEISDVAGKLPGKDMLFTEASIGTWNHGRDLSRSLCRDFNDLVIETVGRGCVGSLVWNFMLDTNGGPYTTDNSGACTTCYGAVDVNPANHALSYNSHYYIMTHASLAAKKGAHRVDTDGWWANNVSYLAFRNADGTYSAIFSNSGDTTHSITIEADGRQYAIDIVPGIMTVVLGQGGEALDPSSPEYDVPTSHTIYFDNSATGWQTPTAFSWGPNSSDSWPGTAMTQHKGSIYKLAVNAEHTGLVFHAGDGDPTKTEDMAVIPNNVYSAAGHRGEYVEAAYAVSDAEIQSAHRYVSGVFNNWSAPGTDDEMHMNAAKGVYTIVVPIHGSGRFCIYGQGWEPKYCKPSASSPAITGPVSDYPVRLATAADNSDTDINYTNLNGDYLLSFNPLALTLSVSDMATVSLPDISAPSTGIPTYYNLQGQIISNPVHGSLYIRHQGPDTTLILY